MFFGKKIESVIKEIGSKIDQSDEDSYVESLLKLPCHERALLGTIILQIEVENGGFDQFFWNLEDERFYKIVRDSLILIHALSFLELYDQAYNMIKPHLNDMHAWQGENDRFEKFKPMLIENGLYKKFRNLSSSFYQLNPNLDKLRRDFYRRNKKLFKN